MTTEPASEAPSAEAFVGRLMEAALGAIDIFSVYLGEQLGYYKALAAGTAMTSAELSGATGTHERYTREWLEQQATTGILMVDDVGASASARRYSLPAGYEAVLVEPLSELYAAPLGRFVPAAFAQAPALLEAFRNGGGVSWADFGDQARTAQADFNRPFFHHHLVPDYISQLPGLDAALRAPGARIAEIGSGGGWAAIAMAAAYPDATVEGFDIDGPSVEMARRNAAESALGGRLTFRHRDAGEAGIDGKR